MFLALPNSAGFQCRAARNAGAESFYLTYFRFGGREEKKGDENVHSHARQKGKRRGGRNEGKKREKRQRTGVGGACANVHRPSVLSRRGAATPGVVSSAACAVTLARYSSSSRACTCIARSCTFLHSSPNLSFLFFYQTLRIRHLRNCILKKKIIRDRLPSRDARENFELYNCKTIVEITHSFRRMLMNE